MQVTHYYENNVGVVVVIGNLVQSEVMTLNQYLKPLLVAVHRNRQMQAVVLDLDGVSMIDSSGIGLICGKCVRLKQQNKKLALCGADGLMKFFSTCGVDQVFPLYTNANQAIHMLGVNTVSEQVLQHTPEMTPPKKRSEPSSLKQFMKPQHRQNAAPI